MKSKIKKGLALLKKIISSDSFQARVFYSLIYNYVRVDSKVILYESYHGKSATGNPYALFLEMMNDVRFKDYSHIWILTNPQAFKKLQKSNVRLIKRDSYLHSYYLLKSKYLINNTTFLPHVNVKETQVYINTWHGTPLKTLGKDVKFSYGNSRNVCKNLLQTDFFISPNRYTTERFLKSNDVDALYSGKIIENGYPRNDLSRLSEEKKANLTRELNLDRTKKVLLYAPTFRGSHLSAKSSDEVFARFVKLLKSNYGYKYNILTKLHHINYGVELDVKIVPETLDTNEVLGLVDVLITDYSSIAFDFLLLKKPILYYVFDLEEYSKERGLYLDMKEMPGVVCKTENGAMEELEGIDSFMINREAEYNRAVDKFCKYDDGSVSKGVIDAIFFKKLDKINIYETPKNDKKRILIYGGAFFNNGVTSSLVSLLNALDYDRYEVYLISTISVESSDFLRTMSRIPKDVKIIYIFQSATKLFQVLYKKMSLNSLKKIFEKENYAFFGNVEFDVAIDYSGYGVYWASMIAFSKAKKKCVYLHSDMKKEHLHRPEIFDFDFLYKLYKHKYDKLIAVSDASYTANMETFYDLKEKLIRVDNLIDERSLTALSKEKNTLNIDESKINFINIARYSVEKSQDRLIEAFFEFKKKNENVHLYLVGHGELQKNLESKIKTLGMSEEITLTGNMQNPFPLLIECDCFVLSSRYEGQGLVLLEAMVLNVACVSTDISGPRTLLDNKYGLLVEDSSRGLLEGMEKFLRGEVPKKEFNHREYAQNALNSFYRAMD